MLYVTDWVVPQFEIDTFWWGVLAAIIVSVVNGHAADAAARPAQRRGGAS